MIWKALVRIARSQLRRWLPGGEVLDGLITDVSEEVTESVYPPPDPRAGTSYPRAYVDVQHQQDQIRSAARAFPAPFPAPPVEFPAKASTVPTLPPRARSSAAPPPIMPAPSRPHVAPPRKR